MKWKFFLLFTLGILCFSKAQETLPSQRTLSLQASAVIPIFYGLHPDGKEWITPSFAPSYLLNLQYKNKRAWLWNIEFQPYSFNYTGPTRLVSRTYYYSHYSSAYTITENVYQNFNFKYNRVHIGFGKQLTFGNKYLSFSIGAAVFAGSFKDSHLTMHISTLRTDNLPPKNQYDSLYVLGAKAKLSPFIGLSGGYSLTDKLTLQGGIYYVPVLMPPITGGYTYVGEPIYRLILQQLVSFNLGLRFNLIGKNSDKE